MVMVMDPMAMVMDPMVKNHQLNKIQVLRKSTLENIGIRTSFF